MGKLGKAHKIIFLLGLKLEILYFLKKVIPKYTCQDFISGPDLPDTVKTFSPSKAIHCT
jgi:hypothetical protein